MENLRKFYFLKLQRYIDKYKKYNIAIYGTGKHTEILLNFLDESIKKKIVRLVDKDPNKVGQTLSGYKIYSLEELKDKVDAIIISSDVYQEIIYERISYLKEEGIDIIKIYDEEFFMPTASNIVYEDINNKYEVIELLEDQYDQWNKFVDESPQGAVFNKTWYLEAVQAKFKIYVCIDKGNNILGGMILPESKPEDFSMPMLTQTLGILLKDFRKLKYVNKISKEKDIIESLVNAIPNFKNYSINFNYNFTNWLPFMWKGYNQYCRYTYVIEDLSNSDNIFNGFRENTKRNIRKALKSNLKVTSNLSLEDFYKINKKTFERQGKDIPYSYEFIKHFDDVIVKNNARKMFFAIDDNGDIYASNYIIYDSKSSFYLMGGINHDFRDNGAASLAMWEAIKFSSKATKKFDFEGSCIRNIEEFFRGFGGTQKMYFNIWKKQN
ncbi:GNAT family N-acetyltransferase [Clostridium botulinum]|uniref:GNAT family N-acetyltransferase n=1 Tax=Clostridium botulinum TaxID=1491 RepID=UPI000A177024|nr:GNAT family N-acetyltransferase [Clostridium botulinum]OSB14037.1 GNAT family N-acetyltransferase [Clostridium botulinum]